MRLRGRLYKSVLKDQAFRLDSTQIRNRNFGLTFAVWSATRFTKYQISMDARFTESWELGSFTFFAFDSSISTPRLPLCGFGHVLHMFVSVIRFRI